MADAGGLLLVHAHPDDEVFSTGGLIARSVAEGRRVDLVTCTGGEEGEIHDPDLDPVAALPRLAEIRLQELRASIALLRGPGPGELRLHLLGYRDSGMMGGESNQHPDCFWQADLAEATGRLVPIVREARPAVIASYDENGSYGHPDHIRAHQVTHAAWEAAADGGRWPEAGSPHATDRLYETAFHRERWETLMEEMKRRGIELPWSDEEEQTDRDEAPGAAPDDAEEREFGRPSAEITTTVDVTPWITQKRAAMAAHRTQRQDFGWALELPDDLAAQISSPEYLVLVRRRVGEIPEGYKESSVFDD